jgi:hypothetical protein
VDTELKPLLTPAEAELLNKAHGRWPEYPETIQKLAHSYYLTVPWQTLPPQILPNSSGLSLWDSYRLKKGPAIDKVLAPPAAP